MVATLACTAHSFDVDLWLLRTPNSFVKAGLEPARDEALRGILLRLEDLDFEHQLLVRCGLQLGKRKEERGEKDEIGVEGMPEWVDLRDGERVTYGAAYESEVRAARVWERKDDRVGPDTIAL